MLLDRPVQPLFFFFFREDVLTSARVTARIICALFILRLCPPRLYPRSSSAAYKAETPIVSRLLLGSQRGSRQRILKIRREGLVPRTNRADRLFLPTDLPTVLTCLDANPHRNYSSRSRIHSTLLSGFIKSLIGADTSKNFRL